MSIITRFRKWLLSSSQHVPTDDPELEVLADRVTVLEERADEQQEHMSQIEVRVGIRNSELWRTARDAS